MNTLDNIREAALNNIDEVERNSKKWIIFAGFFEGILLITYLYCMNMQDRLHWLILIAAFLTYGTVCFLLFSLKNYIKLCNLRVLKAIQAQSKESDSNGCATK